MKLNINKNNSQNSGVIVVGCGRFGSKLAGNLSMQGQAVSVIDKHSDAFRKLPDYFSGLTILGNGIDVEVLESANIANASIVILTSDCDNHNILIAHIAKKIYGVENVYVRLNDDDKAVLLGDIDVKIICPFELSLKEFNRLSHIANEVE